MTENAEAIQKLEHAYRMKEAVLKDLQRQELEIQERMGVIRCELSRLENQRYTLCSTKSCA